MPSLTSEKAAGVAGLLLIIYCRYIYADCNDIRSIYPVREENNSVDEVFMNVTETNEITLSLVTTPPNIVILESFQDATTTMWIIRVNGTLDAEKATSISGNLYCNDTRTPTREWKNDVNIAVTDVNEFPPNFTQSVYTVSVNEMTPPDTTIFSTINIASDRDATDNIRILYSASSNQNPALFGVNTYGTAIITLRRLDYDFSPRQYNLTITAKEHTAGGLTSTAILTINIQDGDDLNPKFNQTLYNTTVNEGVYSNQVLEINPPISAADADSGLSAPLDYRITQSVPDAGIFSILNNGSIMVTGELQPETTYSISIRVSQVNRSQERFDDAVVLVSVVDINDHAPKMSDTSYTATVSENSPPGTVVVSVNASDGDFGLNAAFVFYFSSASGPFEVDTEGDFGVVKVAEGATIDREKQARYDLQIYAKEVFTSERFTTENSTLMITVLDVNDNSPVFDSNTYTYTIYKNDTVGTKVGQVNATDADEGRNGRVVYSLQHSTSPLFKLDNDTGEITVNATLGDDHIGQVYLVIGAEDQAPDPANRRTSVATVIIIIEDIDLYTPEFNSTSYTLSIPEDEAVNSVLVQLVATDKDTGDQLTYTLLAGNDNDTFNMDPDSGVLSLNRALDRESRDTFDLTVQVSDGQKSSTTSLSVTVLDINDNSPIFNQTSYTFTVKENTGNMTAVGTVYATDFDSGRNRQINYAIMSENSPNPSFKINQNSGEITTSRNLDYEMEARHVLLVSAVDGGQPARTATVTVSVGVEDVNDNSPRFVSDTERISVMEGRSGRVFTAVAHDADSGSNKVIVYSGDGASSLFRVLTNGSIETKRSLPVGDYNVTVTAYNVEPYDVSCTGCVNATLTVMIQVSDVNNEPPQFNQTIYTKTIDEGRVKNPVLRVFATDADTDIAYNSIFYNMVGGVNTNLIYLSPTTGNVYIFGDVDFDPPDKIRLFNFTVEAVNTADSSSKDTALVTINVTDVNDNVPTFANAVYRCHVKENTLSGSKFGCLVNATDIDSGPNGELTYHIEQPLNSPFSVDVNTGDITLSREVDYETLTTYTLTIKAEDKGTPAKYSTCEVVVNVTDVNDNPPTFMGTPYDFSLPETSPAGTLVGTLSATDPDTHSALNFSLVNYRENIFILQRSGALETINATFNCIADFTLNASVSDGVHDVFQPVNAHITSVNRFTPQYTEVFNFSVMENATSGHLVGKVEATDGDCTENGRVSYSVIGGNRNQIFRIDSSSGEITVFNDTLLDYESVKVFKLLVRAEDGGLPPRMNFTTVTVTVIDVDDVPPVFDRLIFSTTILENSPNGTFILELSASDKDTPSDQLRFGLKSPIDGLSVNTTGTVVVSGTLDADGASNVISANVTVSDGSRTDESLIRVTIEDVNDNNPVLILTQKNISVPENADVGQMILNVTAIDGDRTNNGFTYWLTRTDGKFSINVSTGMITVENEFDRRQQDYFSVGVHVSDHGIPPRLAEETLTVVIIDSNHAPVFNESVFIFSVFENASVDSMVGQLVAYDEDRGTSGVIKYSFLSGNQERAFDLDVNTGNITLHSNLDYERHQKYTLSVQAKDTSYSPKSSTGTVIINVRDVPEAPQWPLPLPVVYMMKSRSCDKSRVTAFSRDITTITNSPSPVTYNLFNETDKFSLDNSTGVLTAVDPNVLEEGRYVLTLEACNHDYPDLCSEAPLIIVVTSDTTLSFCPAFLVRNVIEDAPVGHIVVDLNTTADDGMMTYIIKEGDPGGVFDIDRSSGVIMVAKQLDRETTERYALLVEARNGTQTAQTQVVVRVIDVKDTIPTFPLPEYNGQISEGAKVGDPVLMMGGSIILVVTATDYDTNTQLTYSIAAAGDTSNGSFAVNETTGQVTLEKTINRETMDAALADKYTFKILATDEMNTASTIVMVTVMDVNDNNPVFNIHKLSITIPENTAVGVVVTIVNATDADSVDQGKITFSLLSPHNAPFSVSGNTGEIKVNGKLDRENISSYQLEVVVNDSGKRNDTMTVNVTLSDVNDNTPMFENETYVFQVEEGPDGVNTTMTVSATDLDLNSRLTFTIISGNTDNYFQLQTTGNDGVLKVDHALDREGSGMTLQDGMGVLQLLLQVEDTGRSNRLSSTCTVNIQITDINDNDPQFDQIDYTGSIRENSQNNTRVQVNPRLVARDPDNGINGTVGIRYRLETTGVPFRVDAINGTVYVHYDAVTDDIDRETTKMYELQVSAQDVDGTGRQTTTNLTINVIDVNDVAPKFTNDTYTFSVPESGQAVVGQVNAADNDVDITSTIIYEIIDTNNLRFYINQLTGVIGVLGGLDRESQSDYSLNVSASDLLHTGYTTVNITVTDVNDNCPQFSVPVAYFNVTENSDNMTLGVLVATDRDIGVNSQMTFFTNASEVQGIIDVESDGSVVTRKSLDRETTPSYTFLVYVRDHGNPPCVSSSTLRISVLDENDETPVFCTGTLCNNSDINVSILEKSPVGGVVALPQVKDGDEGENGRVTFSLTGKGSDLFSIDPTNGLVRVAQPIDINRLYERGILLGNFSSNATFDLLIVAEDHGIEPRSSNVTLRLSVQEINDGAPEFSKNVYNFTIPEEEINYTVGVVQATAKNSTGLALVYSIIEGGQVEDLFHINSADGTIRTSVELDRETRDRYSFAVQVRDGRVPERTAYAVVFVTLSDINDNYPTFSRSAFRAEVNEDSPPTDVILVKATDRDQSQNARLTYTLSSPPDSTDLFALDSTSGELMVNGSLDRERKSSYTLNITATDGGSPPLSSTVEVVVTVVDVNDNEPSFINTPYIVYVTEDSPQGHELLDVEAKDPDAGLNGQVVYRLQPGIGNDVFQIGALDGKLTTVVGLDFESTQVYHLTVMAHDLGTPPLNSTTSITVYVNDTYDTKPVFTVKFYSVTVAMATPTGTPLNVNLDAGKGNFYFNITEGNSDNLFTIDPNTGIISVAREITAQGNLLLTVMASDKMPVTSSDTTKVYVTITEPDVTFPDPLYSVRIPENSNPPVKLLDLNSSAELQGLLVSYSFTDQSENTDAFTVNRSTGVLICSKSLNREEKADYKLFIRVALETNSPVRTKRAVGSNIVEVVVAVEDINDNSPTITAPGTGRVYGIPSTATANYLVVHLQAYDPDESENSLVRFSTASGDTEVFGVNPTSGEVRSLVAMSDVTATEFTLTVNVTDKDGHGLSTTLQITIKAITEAEQFGLVAHMQPEEFNKNKDNLIGNLSSILGLDVQLEAVQPHSEGGKLDLTRSDVYFHAIDPATGEAAPYTEILKQITANQGAVITLLGSSTLLPVTPAPTIVPTVKVTMTKYGISEAEIAVLVIAGIMFIGSVAAVVAIIRIFKRYEDWHQKQEKAKLARERQRKITEERTVDEGFNETNVDSDTAEPLDLDASEESGSREFDPGLLLRQTRMSETQQPLPLRQDSYEDQEQVMDFGVETKDCDTIVLRNLLVSRDLDKVLELFDAGDSTSDSGTGLDSLAEDFDKSCNDGQVEATSSGYIPRPPVRRLNSPADQYSSVQAVSSDDNSEIPGGVVYAAPRKSAPSSLPKKSKLTSSKGSNKGSVKSNKSKNVRFTNVVTIDPADSGNSSDSETHPADQESAIKLNTPLLLTSVDEKTGDLLTWF